MISLGHGTKLEQAPNGLKDGVLCSRSPSPFPLPKERVPRHPAHRQVRTARLLARLDATMSSPRGRGTQGEGSIHEVVQRLSVPSSSVLLAKPTSPFECTTALIPAFSPQEKEP